MTNLILIDDDRLFLYGVKDLLRQSMPDVAITIAHNLDEMLQKIEQTTFHIAVVDLQLRDGSTPQRVLYELRSRNIKILVVSGTATPGMLRFLVGSGARGFHDKADLPKRLEEAIRLILQGKPSFPDTIFDSFATMLPSDGFPLLEEDEERILALIICNNRISNKEIGRKFDDKSDGWAKIKLKGLCHKFNVHDRDFLLDKLMQLGLIPEPDVEATLDKLRRARSPAWPNM